MADSCWANNTLRRDFSTWLPNAAPDGIRMKQPSKPQLTFDSKTLAAGVLGIGGGRRLISGPAGGGHIAITDVPLL
jgi:hypothetical protein